MAIIFAVCISVLCLIFIPKIRASKKPKRQSSSGSVISRTSLRSDTDGSGIKILSSPKAIAELEEENRKLKHLMGSGRRLTHPQVSNDSEVGGCRSSLLSNDSVVVESDIVPEKRVTFGGAGNGEEENHTEMNLVDEEAGGGNGDIEEEEQIDNQLNVVNGGSVRSVGSLVRGSLGSDSG